MRNPMRALFLLLAASLSFGSMALAHDSWISRGLFRNANGEFCCGQVDCFVIAKERVVMTGEGYVIIQGPLAGMGPVQHEAIPFSEAQPSPDGEFWRCRRRPDGSCVDGPCLARDHLACSTEVACSHVSGLLVQSGWTAGPDGVRE